MKRILIVKILLLTSIIVFGQEKVDSSWNSWFQNIPSLSISIEELGTLYHPQGRTTPCQQYVKTQKGQLQFLADKSNHQSRLLSMLTGKFDEESGKYDFSKVAIRKDKKLQEAIVSANELYFRAMDDYNRIISKRIDSSWQKASGKELARIQWKIYQQELSILIKQVRLSQVDLDRLMNKNGFYKQIQSGNPDYPYYIQALEAKGLMLDRVIKLVELIDGAAASVVMIMMSPA